MIKEEIAKFLMRKYAVLVQKSLSIGTDINQNKFQFCAALDLKDEKKATKFSKIDKRLKFKHRIIDKEIDLVDAILTKMNFA